MKASAIKTECIRKNECPIEGHPFLPNKKSPESCLSIFGKCNILGSNIESVKTFSWLQEEVSINLANEIENCLLRSGKDRCTSVRCKMLHLTPIRCYILLR